jgi:hypothetical protein
LPTANSGDCLNSQLQLPIPELNSVLLNVKVTTDGQSASLSWCQVPIWDLRPDFFLSDSCKFVDVGRPLRREDGSVFYNVQSTIYLHFTYYYRNVYTQYIQGFSHSSLTYLSSSQRTLPYNHFALTEQETPFPTNSIVVFTDPLLRKVPSIVACVFVAAGTCLPIRFLETGCVTPFLFAYCIATAVHARLISMYFFWKNHECRVRYRLRAEF